MEVDANLYEFLRENETGLMRNEHGLVFYVHVYFHDLDTFREIVGPYPFDEGGINVLMFDETICIDLNDIIEGQGHKITSYKNCIDEFELKRFEKEFRELEESE